MFSTRFLRGGLKTSVVHVYISDGTGADLDFRFHWLENEDCEDIAYRFELQLNEEIALWSMGAAGLPEAPATAETGLNSTRVPLSTALHVEKASNDCADHEVLQRIMGILRAHELQELLFKEQCKYLDAPAEPTQLDTLTMLDLTGCALTEVPSSIANLLNLKIVNLSKNKLMALPQFFGSMHKLETLKADDNALTTLPGMPPQECLHD